MRSSNLTLLPTFKKKTSGARHESNNHSLKKKKEIEDIHLKLNNSKHLIFITFYLFSTYFKNNFLRGEE